MSALRIASIVLLLSGGSVAPSLNAATSLAASPTGDRGSGVPNPACEDGTVKDDGSVESGYGWVPSVVEGIFVQEYLEGEIPWPRVDRVCLCWLRTRPDDSIDFDVVFYAESPDGGPQLEPFASVPARAEGVPDGVPGAFYEIDVGGVSLPDGTVYIGARWDPSVDQFFFVCDDQTESTPFTNIFFIDDRADAWGDAETTNDPIFIPHRALLVRPVAAVPGVVEVPALGAPGALALIALVLAVGVWRLASGGARTRGSRWPVR